MSNQMTNREFAKQDQTFKECCGKVIVGYTEKKDGSGNALRDNDGRVIMEAILLPPTVRQASKFRNKKGAAYKVLKALSDAWDVIDATEDEDEDEVPA